MTPESGDGRPGDRPAHELEHAIDVVREVVADDHDEHSPAEEISTRAASLTGAQRPLLMEAVGGPLGLLKTGDELAIDEQRRRTGDAHLADGARVLRDLLLSGLAFEEHCGLRAGVDRFERGFLVGGAEDMLGFRRGIRMDRADEVDQPLNRLALGGLRRPKAIERLAIGVVGIGEFDHLGRTGRTDHKRIGWVDRAEPLSRARILGHCGDVDAVLVVDGCEQQMTTLRRKIDDAPTGRRLIDGSLDGRRSEVLKAEVGEGLAQLTLGVCSRRRQGIGRSRYRSILRESGCSRDQQRSCQQFSGATHWKPPRSLGSKARKSSRRS